MEQVHLLEKYGLFDAKVPRYTSYPPANRFELNVGRRHQQEWLRAVPAVKPVSIYIHIPFCRRLCWFCACRTQGTQTLAPVEDYVGDVVNEITRVAKLLPEQLPMARLHLGGGTPTLLSPELMDTLLNAVFTNFEPAQGFEFSVEVDPTEAAPELLERLRDWNMGRASIGVQDFADKVQDSIGRPQSFEQTQAVAMHLRALGVQSLNLDLLYGLPYQTRDSLQSTLEKVRLLDPDRIALYGYAHVPHVSKRQVMIPEAELPDPLARFGLSRLAHRILTELGYEPLGIDHYAKPGDSLAIAAENHRMRRNFQGYTDDPCETLLGFGASAISKFPQGYVQNAVATAAYRARAQESGLAGHKGYLLTPKDLLLASMIEEIMCYGRIDYQIVAAASGYSAEEVAARAVDLNRHYPEVVDFDSAGLSLPTAFSSLTRIISAKLENLSLTGTHHSQAV